MKEFSVRAISRDFKKLDGKLQKRIVLKANRRGAALIAKKAKELAPKRTRAGLRQFKIVQIKKVDKSYERGHTIIFDTPKGSRLAPYMYFQEVGTKYLKPKLFLETAFDLTKNEAERLVKQTIVDEIDKELKKMGWR